MASIPWDEYQNAADEAGFVVLPPSTYDVVVATAEAKKTSTGKDSIAVRFKVESGPYQNQGVFNNFTISPENPNALGFFFRHMKALGLGKEYFATSPTTERVAADLVGRRCQVKVSIRQWNEEDRNQVDGVLPAAGNAPVPMVGAVPTPKGTPAVAPAPLPLNSPVMNVGVTPAPSTPPAPPAPPF